MKNNLSPMLNMSLKSVLGTLKSLDKSIDFIQKDFKQAQEVEEFESDHSMIEMTVTIIESIIEGKIK